MKRKYIHTSFQKKTDNVNGLKGEVQKNLEKKLDYVGNYNRQKQIQIIDSKER